MAKKASNKGLSLAARLDAWARVFSARKDISVRSLERGKPWKGAAQAIHASKEIDQFYTENNGFELVWDLPERASAGLSTGALVIKRGSGTQVLWYEDNGRRSFSYKIAILIDEPSNEANTLFAHRYIGDTRKVEKVLVFDDASSNESRTFDSFELYLTEGAKRAFAWYWQQPSATTEEILGALRAISADPATPRDALEARIVAAGASADEAKALYDWLGPDASLLVPKS